MAKSNVNIFQDSAPSPLERAGERIFVKGIGLIDGSMVLDIKTLHIDATI